MSGGSYLKKKSFIELLIIFVTLVAMLQPLLTSILNLNDSLTSILKSIDKIAFLPIFTLAFINICLRKYIYTEKLLLIIFIILSFIALLSSLMYTHSLVSSFMQYILTFQGVILFFLLLQIDFKEDFFERYLKLLSIIGVVTILIAFAEFIKPEVIQNFIHGNNIKEMAVIRGDYRSIISIFSHPELFAWFMGFMFCVNLALYLTTGSKKYLYFAIVFLLAVILSLRRKSILACILVSLIAVLISNKNQSFKISYFAGAAILLASSFVVFYDKVIFLYENTVTRYLSNEGFYTPRTILLNESLILADSNFPFGTGMGTFGSWMSTVFYSPLYEEIGLSTNYGMTKDFPIFLTDTYWPMIIAELGWFGFMFMMLFWGALILKLFKSQLNKPMVLKTHALISIFALLQLIIESTSSPSLSRSPQIFIVMVLVAVTLKYSYKASVCRGYN